MGSSGGGGGGGGGVGSGGSGGSGGGGSGGGGGGGYVPAGAIAKDGGGTTTYETYHTLVNEAHSTVNKM